MDGSLLMRGKTLATLLLLALAAILAACQGEEENVTPSPTPALEAQLRQQLEELSTDALLTLTFPGVALTPPPLEDPLVLYVVKDEPSWRIQVLGRLIGHFTRRDQPQQAVFLYLHGPTADGETPALSQVLELPEGLFMALVGLDSHAQPALAGLSLLDSSAAEFLEPAPALEQGLRPFRQSSDNLAPGGLMSPALAVDTDNDGLEELVLLDAGVSDGVAAAFYLIFRWTGSDLHWQRVAPPLEGASADLPTQTVLDYLAAVAAATATAEPWQDSQRFLVWQWLTSSDEPITDELLHEIADDDSDAALAAAHRKLETTRALFSEAYNLLSADRQKLQPWPDFINGFRNATGTEVKEMLPPSREDEHTSVQVVIVAFSREGPDMVQRRFRVTYHLVRSEEGWRLNDVDAKEERLPE